MTFVQPFSTLRGTVHIPASKPHCQRAFLFAALAEGQSHIHHLNTCSETQIIAQACQAFGAALEYQGMSVGISGVAGRPQQPDSILRVAGSGVALRNLLAMASLADGPSVLTGNQRLAQRPLLPLVEGLRA